MPIYPYLCGSCGHHQDVLQKMSDPALTHCTQCGAETFAKQLSAPAFQLKGSGWYVTDFRENGKKPDAAEAGKEGSTNPPDKSDKAGETGVEKGSEKGGDKPADKATDKASDKAVGKPVSESTKTAAVPTPAAPSTSTPKAPPATP
jgi:putative FmdB family regulatory protein